MRLITKVVFDCYQDTTRIRRILDDINKSHTPDEVEAHLETLRDEAATQLQRLRERMD